MSIPILMYHSISNDTHKLSISPKIFFKQLKYLNSNGYQSISFKELNNKNLKKKFIITFDDGYEDIYKNALPILKKFNFLATCFFVSNLIGKYNSWDENKNFYFKKKLMNMEQISKWISEGMGIGSHTKNHYNLTELKCLEKKSEIEEPIDFFKRNFSYNVNSFSYPYGKYDLESLKIVKENYDFAVNTQRSRYHFNKFDFHEIPRVPVNKSCGFLKFYLKLKTIYEDIKFKNVIV